MREREREREGEREGEKERPNIERARKFESEKRRIGRESEEVGN